MIKKIKTVGDLADAYLYLPHLKEMELDDATTWLDPHDDDHAFGWYWDDEKKELFRPIIVLSEPGWDMIFIMKESMEKDDDFFVTKYVNWWAGACFYNKEPDWSKEKILKENFGDIEI